MPTPATEKIIAVLNRLDAERLIVTTQARTKLIRELAALLDTAVAQAKKGSPALLRLITRAVLRDVNPDRARPRRRS